MDNRNNDSTDGRIERAKDSALGKHDSNLTQDDDNFYRSHYESSNRLADRGFEDVRPAYHLGHVAAHNPDYANRSWNDVESDLQRGWNSDASQQYGDWSTVR